VRFKKVYLEITNVCNLRCPFCPPSGRAPGFMSRERFLQALEQLAPYTRYLYFHIKGEPLLHPLLPEFLGLAGDRGFQVNLTTNGVLLPSRARELLEAPALRQTNISLHSFCESHGEGEAYICRAAAFARAAAERGKHTVFRVWTLDDGRRAAPELLRLLEFLGREFPGQGDLAQAVGRRSVTLGEHIFLSFEEEFVWPGREMPVVSEEGSCYGTRTMCGVLWDGTVVPCCLDGEGACPLGNLFQEDFSRIVESEAFEAMAEGFRRHRLTQDLCRRCGYRSRFS
jgi:radical SAM protein with 4Fe4S-binding SPASM domain